MRRSLPISLLVAAHCLLAPVAAWAADAPPAPEAAPASEISAGPSQFQVRQDRLALHQGLALGALGGMVVTAILGQVYESQKANFTVSDTWKAAHVTSAVLTTLLYGGAATAALSAPQPTTTAEPGQGFDPMVLHRTLTWVHALTLGSTVALGMTALLEPGIPGLAGVHQVLGWSTTGLMAVSGGLIVLNF